MRLDHDLRYALLLDLLGIWLLEICTIDFEQMCHLARERILSELSLLPPFDVSGPNTRKRDHSRTVQQQRFRFSVKRFPASDCFSLIQLHSLCLRFHCEFVLRFIKRCTWLVSLVKSLSHGFLEHLSLLKNRLFMPLFYFMAVTVRSYESIKYRLMVKNSIFKLNKL